MSQPPAYPPGQQQGYPPQGGVQYAQPQPVAVAMPMRFGEQPVSMRCVHCHQDMVTTTVFTSGLMTWLVAGGICLVGCWAGCCLIPFCVDACKDVSHCCPKCNVTVGVYKRIS